jgi:hypothetical protein
VRPGGGLRRAYRRRCARGLLSADVSHCRRIRKRVS